MIKMSTTYAKSTATKEFIKSLQLQEGSGWSVVSQQIQWAPQGFEDKMAWVRSLLCHVIALQHHTFIMSLSLDLPCMATSFGYAV